jgi:hypothetical protein
MNSTTSPGLPYSGLDVVQAVNHASQRGSSGSISQVRLVDMEFMVDRNGLGRGFLRVLWCSPANYYTIPEYSLSSRVGTLGAFVAAVLFIYLFILGLFNGSLSTFGFLHQNSQVPLLWLDKKHRFLLEKIFCILHVLCTSVR